MLTGPELKKNPAPRGGKIMGPPKLLEGPLHGYLAFGIGADGCAGSARQRGTALMANIDPRPIIFRTAPGHDGANAAAILKRAQQVLARLKPAIILGAVPIEPGRRDPGEMQQMSGANRLDERIDRRRIEQIGAVRVRAGALIRANRLVRKNSVHIVTG